jgi:DNA primase large subunit
MVFKLHLYPFLSEASEYVNKTSVDELLKSRAFEFARMRGRERVLQALQGEIRTGKSSEPTVELFSYPFARIAVSCINDAYLTRRYAVAESKFIYWHMLQEDAAYLKKLGDELRLGAVFDGTDFRVRFSDYADLASSLGPKWKLVNRKVEKGFVFITKEEFARLLQEKIRERLGSTPAPKMNRQVCDAVKTYTDEIRKQLESIKGEHEEFKISAVKMECFPPCMKHILGSVSSSLSHPARFAITSFLLRIGMKEDEVVKMFSNSPDFDEEQTSYQVRHIAGRFGAGTEYTPPSCATMNTYQNCSNPDDLCRRIKHPITYYKRKLRSEKAPTGSP